MLIPFESVLLNDNRNYFTLFGTLFLNHFGILNLLCFRNPVKLFIICLSSYILDLSLDMTFNAILFSDDIISQKYESGRQINLNLSLLLSFLSNIIGNIISSLVGRIIGSSLPHELIIKESKKNKTC